MNDNIGAMHTSENSLGDGMYSVHLQMNMLQYNNQDVGVVSVLSLEEKVR